LAAAVQPQPFYPLTTILAIHPSPRGYAWWVVARLFLAGFFAALFDLDGLGYIVLTAALYLPAFARFRRLTRWALIALTAATIVAYFVLIQGQYDAIGIADKIAEVALIVLLVIEGRRERRGNPGAEIPGV